jgi:hypothetical protein
MPGILFVTTLSLSANPRLYKEILLADQSGYDIHVIFFRLGNWTDHQDEEKMRTLPRIRFTRLSATRSPIIPWLIGTMLEKISRRLLSFSSHPMLCSLAAGKRAYNLEQALARLSETHGLVIAHNPAAFLPATRFARRVSARLGIDVEDYHPGETSDPLLSEALRVLMRHSFKTADYVSFASPMIRREAGNDAQQDDNRWITLLNWFPAAEFTLPAESLSEGPLKLVWFSQHVAANRGLELVIPAIKRAGADVELHIFGHPDQDFVKSCIDRSENIFLHGPVTQKELHRILGKYDIGLAIDVVADRNRALAITNKILAYLQAGLYLAVTNTEAQQAFMRDFQQHGTIFEQDSDAWEELLPQLIRGKEEIRKNKADRYVAMLPYAWEQTSAPLLAHWENISKQIHS